MTTPEQAEVASRIRADRATWQAIVDEAGPERLDEPGPMGDWSLRDLAGHLAGWRNRRIAQLEALARGESDAPAPWPEELQEDDDINAWIREHDAGRSTEEILADYAGSFDRLADAIEALPPEAARGPFPGTDSGPILEADFLGHLHDEHLPTIQAWLAEGRD